LRKVRRSTADTCSLETEGIRREEVDRRPRPVLAPPEDRSLVDQDVAFLASDDDQEDDRTLHDGGRC